MNANEIQIPSEFARLLDSDWREAAVYGGRGSLKSHTVARVLLIKAMQRPGLCGCFREFQNSIADSSHALLSGLIEFYNLPDFEITKDSIRNTRTGYNFIFRGKCPFTNCKSNVIKNYKTQLFIKCMDTVSY